VIRPLARNAVILADSSVTLRRLAAQLQAPRARAAGASSELVDDALAQAAQRSIADTRRSLQWARALNGSGPMPRGFRPDVTIAEPMARAVALASLEARLNRAPSIQLERQRLYLDPDVTMAEIEEFVSTTLARLLDQRSSGKFSKTIKVRQAFAVMGSLIDRLEGRGHRPFLVSGTLLGVVREGDLLEQDYDVDLGLLPGDGSVEEIAELVGSISGFRVVEEEFRVLAEHDSGVGIDIFLHYERDGRLWHATDIHEWWNTPFDLERVSVRGRQFWTPDDRERYLDENYGDWSKPIAFYHMSFDTPNREYRKNKHGLLYLYNIMVTAIENNDRFVAESAARELRDSFGVDLTDRFNDGPLLEPRP
jgi:hypothetical protein